MAVGMFVSLLEREYALGSNVLGDTVMALGWFPNSGEVEDVTTGSWGCATWNNK